jgi:hypothetical protein
VALPPALPPVARAFFLRSCLPHGFYLRKPAQSAGKTSFAQNQNRCNVIRAATADDHGALIWVKRKFARTDFSPHNTVSLHE